MLLIANISFYNHLITPIQTAEVMFHKLLNCPEFRKPVMTLGRTLTPSQLHQRV